MSRNLLLFLVVAGAFSTPVVARAGQRLSLAEREAAALPQCGEGSQDADEDGLCDRLERATGTNPYDADTDDDSVPDGEEDANRDGRVGPGESDPREPGLFPGSAPHIPEPLVFDLVRGLGAKRGELEANVLTLVDFGRGAAPRVEWAPEVEWAVLDDVALELELPVDGTRLAAVKAAVQVTFPGGGEKFVHGAQGIGEHFVAESDAPKGATRGSLLYLAGVRGDAWSVFGMLGGRLATGGDAQREPAPGLGSAPPELLFNPSVFYDVAEELTLGWETNLAASRDGQEWRLIPQLHYQLSRHFRFQLGGGVHIADGHVSPIAASRLVVE